MKKMIVVAASLALLTPAAVAAQEAAPQGVDVESRAETGAASDFLAAEFEELGSLFGEIFAADPLTAEEEDRLPLAVSMTDYVFPVGSFAVLMEQSMEPMMDAISAMSDDPAIAISVSTGVSPEDLGGLEEDALEEALALFDPHYVARNERIEKLAIAMIGDLFEAIEPAYREGLSRALATRFEASEMEALIAFFQTDLGGKFARQSFLVHYDPQTMAAMDQLLPAMSEVLPGMLKEVAAITEAYPEGRSFADLTPAEKARAARLLGRSEAELEALQPAEQSAGERGESGLTS